MPFSQFTGRKIVITVSILLITLIIGLIFLFTLIYYDINQELQADSEDAIQLAMNHAPIEQVTSTYFYNGEQSYTVLKGDNNDKEIIYVFVPKNISNSDEIKWIEQSEGLTKEEIISQFNNSCNHCDLLQVTPGILNDQFIWEIVYETNERILFQTFRFTNGELYDSISFRKK
ncbi:cell wall elongation regulator TseB-like domain-containing protein [Bacillaceae bacterium W0354]